MMLFCYRAYAIGVTIQMWNKCVKTKSEKAYKEFAARLDARTARRRSVLADIFIPQFGVLGDVAGQQIDARFGFEVDHFNAVLF